MVQPLARHPQQQQDMNIHNHDDNNVGEDGLELHRNHTSEAASSPTESESTSSGCSSAGASNSDRDASPRCPAVQPQDVADQPRPSPPSTPPDTGGGASACCGCTGDGERSTRPGDRSVSRGTGYCCTVQPLDRPVTPLSPQPPPSSTAVSPTPPPAGWPSVDVTTTSRDELLLTAPRLVSPADRRSSRPYPPPLPPPRRTSLKSERKQDV